MPAKPYKATQLKPVDIHNMMGPADDPSGKMDFGPVGRSVPLTPKSTNMVGKGGTMSKVDHLALTDTPDSAGGLPLSKSFSGY